MPIFETAEETLRYLFNENISLQDLITKAYGKQFYSEVAPLFKDIALGGSPIYGLATQESDVDILVYTSSLEKVANILRSNHIDFEFEKFPANLDLLGTRNSITISSNSYKNRNIEIYLEEAPIKMQKLPIHSQFLKEKFLGNKEMYFHIKKLKHLAECGDPDGYRKAHIFIFELEMIKDSGFLPQKEETSHLGYKYPKWEGKVSPFDWIYLKKVFGLPKAKKICQDIENQLKTHVHSINDTY